jgi:hypothetical protein
MVKFSNFERYLSAIKYSYQIWVVPLNLAGVLMDPVEQWKVEVRGVVVSEFSAGSPLAVTGFRSAVSITSSTCRGRRCILSGKTGDVYVAN